MRLSTTFAPTLRQAPSHIESTGHRLLVQAGFLRRSGTGAWVWLPLGKRVVHRVCTLVRDEMRHAGLQEVLTPVLQPAAKRETSDQWTGYGRKLLNLKDRSGRKFVLGPDHDDLMADVLSGDIRSYRQLPLRIFHVHPQFRDQHGPGAYGRSRESLAITAYSFDCDEGGRTLSHRLMIQSWTAAFKQLDLDVRPLAAGPGPAGDTAPGTVAEDRSCEFVAISDSGDVRLIGCPSCGYLARPEAAGTRPAEDGEPPVRPPATPAASDGRPEGGPVRISTPGMHTVEAVAGFLGVGPEALIKTMIVLLPDGTPAVGLVRGDHELSPGKLARTLGTDAVELADAATVERISGAPVGFAGPVGLGGIVTVADHAVTQMATAVTGANEGDAHLTGVRPGRDFGFDLVADIREVDPGDPCPSCTGLLEAKRGTWIGLAQALEDRCGGRHGLQFAGEDGTLRPVLSERCAVDVLRVVVALVEAHHDAAGISWPLAAAPGHVLVLPVNDRDASQLEAATRIYDELLARGVQAVLDDRSERAGVKFNDADLQGWPLRVTIGSRGLARGEAELHERAGGTKRPVPLDTVTDELATLVGERLLRHRKG